MDLQILRCFFMCFACGFFRQQEEAGENHPYNQDEGSHGNGRPADEPCGEGYGEDADVCLEVEEDEGRDGAAPDERQHQEVQGVCPEDVPVGRRDGMGGEGAEEDNEAADKPGEEEEGGGYPAEECPAAGNPEQEQGEQEARGEKGGGEEVPAGLGMAGGCQGEDGGRVRQGSVVEGGAFQPVHEIVGEEHGFHGSGGAVAALPEDGVDAPLHPRGDEEVFVEEVPEAFDGLRGVPVHRVREALQDDVAAAGGAVVEEEVVKIRTVFRAVVLCQYVKQPLFLEGVEAEALFVDAASFLAVSVQEIAVVSVRELVREQPAGVFQVEMRGVEVESAVVEHAVEACRGVFHADGGVPEEGVELIAGRAGQEADFRLGGEGKGFALSAEEAGCQEEKKGLFHGLWIGLYPGGVFDVTEEEGVPRGGTSGTAAVPGFDDAAEVFGGELALSHLHQGADNGAHHVAQEAVGFDGEYQLLAGVFPAGFHDGAEVGAGVGMELGETGEVLVFEEYAAGFVHPFDIGEGPCPPGGGAGEGVFVLVDVVPVGARQGGEAGMDAVGHGVYPFHGDAAVKEAVELVNKPVGVVHRGVRVEVGDIKGGMDARVRPPGAHDGDVPAQEGGEGAVQVALYGGFSGLHLPAAVAVPVV